MKQQVRKDNFNACLSGKWEEKTSVLEVCERIFSEALKLIRHFFKFLIFFQRKLFCSSANICPITIVA